jgi:hypothetical protein
MNACSVSQPDTLSEEWTPGTYWLCGCQRKSLCCDEKKNPYLLETESQSPNPQSVTLLTKLCTQLQEMASLVKQ